MQALIKFILLLTLPLAAGGLPPTGLPAAPPVLTAEALPRQQADLLFCYADPLPAGLPPQLLCEDETAYRLALSIQNYLPYNAAALLAFDEAEPIPPQLALEIALHHTAPLDLGISYGPSGDLADPQYPAHPVTARVQALLHAGQDPAAVLSAADVRQTADLLFGPGAAYADGDAAYYRFYPDEGIYIQFGDLAGARTAYPQILSYAETDDGFVCIAVLVHALDADTPQSLGGLSLTRENLAAAAAGATQYRFTFTARQGGPLLLCSLERLS